MNQTVNVVGGGGVGHGTYFTRVLLAAVWTFDQKPRVLVSA